LSKGEVEAITFEKGDVETVAFENEKKA